MNLARETFLTLPLRDLRDPTERFAPDYPAKLEEATILQRAKLARKALKNLQPLDDGTFRRDMHMRKRT